MSHLETTPTGRSHPSRSFIPSPPGPARRLTFGSSKKEGYGIVSASGFNAWKRGLKRGSTSTKANTTATTISNRNAIDRDEWQKKKGLGMGLEGTPAKKRFKRDSGKSKPSMGNQSTPKGSISRKVNHDDPSTSMSMTISSFTASPSQNNSSVDADSPVPPVRDSFAIGAETIIGEDVFGLTISIEADDPFRARSPSPALSTASSIPWVINKTSRHERTMARWYMNRSQGASFDAANADAVDEQDEEEEWVRDGLIYCAETEVPVNFGDSESGMEEVRNDDSTLRAIPQEIIDEAWSDLCDATRVWDITVPIRDTSVLVYGWRDLDATDFAQIDHVCAASFEQDQRYRDLVPGGLVEDVPTDIREGGPSRARGRNGEIRNAHEDDQEDGSDINAIEASRGLNLSRIGMDDPSLPADTDMACDAVEYDVDVPSSDELSPNTLKRPGSVNTPSVTRSNADTIMEEADVDLQISMNGCADDHRVRVDKKDEERFPPDIEEIDHTSRVRRPPGVLDQDPCLRGPSVSDSTSNATTLSVDDPTGFKAAARYMKRERPRWYRATSSPTPSPPARDLSAITFSPTPTPSVSSMELSEHDEAVYIPGGQPCWVGAWKGSGRQKRIKKTGVIGDIGIESRSGAEGRGQYVDKVFIEPAYYGRAKAARDARIAHYKDLETNYKLHVEEVYF